MVVAVGVMVLAAAKKEDRRTTGRSIVRVTRPETKEFVIVTLNIIMICFVAAVTMVW